MAGSNFGACSQFVADNENKLADAARKADEARQSLAKAAARLSRTNLYAPIDGVAHQKSVTTVGQVVASAPSGKTVTISDTAAHIGTNLSASEIAGLKGIGVTAITATGGSVTLTVAQAAALETATLKVTVSTGYKVTLSDTAANVESLATGQIAGLKAVGISGITATGASVVLSVAQAQALEAAAVTLAAPSGDIAMIVDTAANIAGMTSAQIASLTTLHVTQIQASDANVTLSVAQAQALETAKVSLLVPTGDTAIIVDTAADLAKFIAAQIASLSTLHVSAVDARDTNLALTTAQAIAFENAHIALSAPASSVVEVSDTAAHLQALTAAQIAALPGTGIDELYSSNANVSYTSAQTAAILSGDILVGAASAYTVTENFANGNYSVFKGGALVQQKTVNADTSYDIAYLAVTGQAYSSYEDIYNAAHAKVATAQDMTSGSGNLILAGSGLTVFDASGQESVTTGSDIFAIKPHAVETTTASGQKSETFDFDSGFGHAAITGFLATGSTHDVIQLDASMFSYLSPGMTQAQDLAALLASATQVGSNLQIVDLASDVLTLNAISKATLTANPADFKFT